MDEGDGTWMLPESPRFVPPEPTPPEQPPDITGLRDSMFNLSTPENIRLVYHPSSGLPDKVVSLDEYLQEQHVSSHSSSSDSNSANASRKPVRPPWYPFRSFEDFDLAEYITENNLSQAAINELLRRHRNVWSTSPGNSKISFKNYNDL